MVRRHVAEGRRPGRGADLQLVVHPPGGKAEVRPHLDVHDEDQLLGGVVHRTTRGQRKDGTARRRAGGEHGRGVRADLNRHTELSEHEAELIDGVSVAGLEVKSRDQGAGGQTHRRDVGADQVRAGSGRTGAPGVVAVRQEFGAEGQLERVGADHENRLGSRAEVRNLRRRLRADGVGTSEKAQELSEAGCGNRDGREGGGTEDEKRSNGSRGHEAGGHALSLRFAQEYMSGPSGDRRANAPRA